MCRLLERGAVICFASGGWYSADVCRVADGVLVSVDATGRVDHIMHGVGCWLYAGRASAGLAAIVTACVRPVAARADRAPLPVASNDADIELRDVAVSAAGGVA